MKESQFSRIEYALGQEGLAVIKNAHVLVLGVGGVGAIAAESLVRSGVGRITIVDNDVVDISNINRQIQATHETVGLVKVDALKERLHLINPEVEVVTKQLLITEDNVKSLVDTTYDFVIDAIDTVKMKSLIIMRALEQNIPVISSMAMGNKLDPTKIKIDSIWKTKYDPIAKIVRKTLRENRLGNAKINVVFSEEIPIVPIVPKEKLAEEKMPPSSNMFVPSVSGLFCANYVVRTLLDKNNIVINRKNC